MLRWYVVNTQPRAEAQAALHLERQGFATYLPRYLRKRRHARRVETVAAPLFPRYLFVAVDLEAARWRAIHSTVGVHHLVCQGDQPAAVPDGIVDEIRARQDAAGMVILDERQRVPYRRGTRVVVRQGALAESVGLFDCMGDEERAVVLLDLLGRKVRVRLPLESIEAA